MGLQRRRHGRLHLADDTDRLGRSYLGDTGRLTDADRDAWVQTVREQLADASAASAEEAARLVLHRSIADIKAHRPTLVRPALTSRDIAGLTALPGGPRAAFARIAMLVERSLFARRALAADDWRDCRAAYEEFAFAESWSG